MNKHEAEEFMYYLSKNILELRRTVYEMDKKPEWLQQLYAEIFKTQNMLEQLIVEIQGLRKDTRDG